MSYKRAWDPKAKHKRVNKARWQSEAGPGKWVNKMNADKVRRLRERLDETDDE